MGLGFSGKIRYYKKQCDSRGSILDTRRVNFYVSQNNKGFYFFGVCYCTDAILVSGASNHLTVYLSKSYPSQHEAALAVEQEIISLSREFQNTTFYMEKYFVEHDLFGDSRACLNGHWSEKENNVVLVCNECRREFEEKLKNAVCSQCGGYVT